MKTSSRADALRLPLLAAAALIAALAVLPGNSNADDFHYRSLLVGNRAAGMGGAYTAVSDDPSGLFYNPAGTVYTDGANVSASSNAFQYGKTVYKNAIGSSDWKRTSSTLLPNFFGVVQTVGSATVGLSYAVPDTVNENLDQSFTNIASLGLDRYVLNLNQIDDTYLFGPSIAFGGKGFSAGLTVYGHYRHNESTLNQWIKYTSSGMQYQENLYYENTEMGLKPIFGIMYSPTDTISLGLTANRTFVLDSSTRKQLSVMYEGSSNDAASNVQVLKSNAKREYPWNFTVGAAWYPDPSFLIDADFSVHTKTSNDEFSQAEPTWNAALGMEYYMSRAWAFRAGLFTNNANTLKLKKGYVEQDPHIDEYGGSLSMSYFSKSSSLEFGVTYARGEGEDQIISGQTAIQDVTTQSLTFFISANYTF